MGDAISPKKNKFGQNAIQKRLTAKTAKGQEPGKIIRKSGKGKRESGSQETRKLS